MSYKVLVIPEDFTKDEHVLKPVIERILADAGRANPSIQVCRDPNFGGISEALKIERLRTDVIARYPMVDLFVLLVDRDGKAGREVTLANIETELQRSWPSGTDVSWPNSRGRKSRCLSLPGMICPRVGHGRKSERMPM